MSARPLAALALVAGVTLAAMPEAARADRYEATLTLRPTGVLARVDDAGAQAPVTVAGGGLTTGLTWGVRNWLDVGGELTALALAPARYADAMADVFGNPQMGELSRTTRLAHLRGVATLRFGVGWVPTVQASLGVGGRQRTGARLATAAGVVIPDGEEATLGVDVVTGLRVGLAHRLTRRWALGVSGGATAYFGLGAPDLQAFDATVALDYTWYPLW